MIYETPEYRQIVRELDGEVEPTEEAQKEFEAVAGDC